VGETSECYFQLEPSIQPVIYILAEVRSGPRTGRL